MNRQEKHSVVASLREVLPQCEGVFLVGVQGLTVEESEQLRRGVRATGGRLQVIKNTLLKKAAANIGNLPELNAHFKNQIALITVQNNAPAVAKTIFTFAQDHEKMVIVAGYLDQQVIDKQQLVTIATLPSKDVLIARIAGALKSPLIRIAYVLGQCEAIEQKS